MLPLPSGWSFELDEPTVRHAQVVRQYAVAPGSNKSGAAPVVTSLKAYESRARVTGTLRRGELHIVVVGHGFATDRRGWIEAEAMALRTAHTDLLSSINGWLGVEPMLAGANASANASAPPAAAPMKDEKEHKGE